MSFLEFSLAIFHMYNCFYHLLLLGTVNSIQFISIINAHLLHGGHWADTLENKNDNYLPSPQGAYIINNALKEIESSDYFLVA